MKNTIKECLNCHTGLDWFGMWNVEKGCIDFEKIDHSTLEENYTPHIQYENEKGQTLSFCAVLGCEIFLSKDQKKVSLVGGQIVFEKPHNEHGYGFPQNEAK